MTGTTEGDFAFQNRNTRVPAVDPEKHSGQFCELLVSSKETSHVTNVTGPPNSGADIARETYGVSPREKKTNKGLTKMIDVSQDSK